MSLKHGDLKNVVLPMISVDEFEPKSGKPEDVIVVAFYLLDRDPAEDLNTFIQRGHIDTLDVDVSPSTDEEGRYLVFVELGRNETFVQKFKSLIRDIENVTGKLDWRVTTYYTKGQSYHINDDILYAYIVTDPVKYISKDEFTMNEIKEGALDFFSNTFASNLTINGANAIVSGLRHKISMNIVDVGDYDTVIGRNFLKESAFDLGRLPYEASVLEHILGNCKVTPLGGYLCLSNSDEHIMLIKNTQFI